MKTVNLTAYAEKVGENKSLLIIKSVELMLASLRQPPTGGWELDTMRNHLKLLDKLEPFEANFTFTPDEVKEIAEKNIEGELENYRLRVELEDADYVILQGAMKRMKWALLANSIVQILTDLK